MGAYVQGKYVVSMAYTYVRMLPKVEIRQVTGLDQTITGRVYLRTSGEWIKGSFHGKIAGPVTLQVRGRLITYIAGIFFPSQLSNIVYKLVRTRGGSYGFLSVSTIRTRTLRKPPRTFFAGGGAGADLG
jgi:hypothetical protein